MLPGIGFCPFYRQGREDDPCGRFDLLPGTQQAGPGSLASWPLCTSFLCSLLPPCLPLAHSPWHSSFWGERRQARWTSALQSLILGMERVGGQGPKLAGKAPPGDGPPRQCPGPGSLGPVGGRAELASLALTGHRSAFPPRTVIRINIPSSPFLGSYSPSKSTLLWIRLPLL